MKKTTKKKPTKKSSKRKSSVKKTPASTRASKSPTKKSSRKKKPVAKSEFALGVTPEERQHMIAIAAYVRAEKRGFVGGDAGDDWRQAEAEIDALLKKKIGA
jgi:hypothetical protein